MRGEDEEEGRRYCVCIFFFVGVVVVTPLRAVAESGVKGEGDG